MKWVLWVGLVVCGACAPQVLDVKRNEGRPEPEQHEIVPVGGYQILAGEWVGTRGDEVIGSHPMVLSITVEGDVLSGTSTERGIEFRCQAHHRLCSGTWKDYMGRGRLVLTFGMDFASFTGTYDGTSEGRDVGRSSFSATKR